MAPASISWVRHGQVRNPEGIFYGRLPGFGLSERGRWEAQAAASALREAPLSALYSSPLLRATQTARALRRAHPDLKLRISRRLTEIETPYEGRPVELVDALQGDVYSGSEPPFEQPEDVLARVLAFVAGVRERHPDRHVAAVTHGDPIAFLVLWAAGRPVIPRNKASLGAHSIIGGYPATGSVTTLSYRTADPEERPRIGYWKP